MDEPLLPDLLRLRGSVVAASDEFFAAKENLIRPDAPVFVPETYNELINSRHVDAARITRLDVMPYPLDSRLLARD